MAIAIDVKGKNIEVTDGLREYAEKRLKKLERFLPSLKEATVRESVERNLHRVEVTLEGDGLLLRGEERSDNMYASIDLVLDKLEQRLKRFKSRHSHKGNHDRGIRTNGAPHSAAAFTEVLPAELEPDDEGPHLSRVKRVTMKPMTYEDAARMMEMVDHDFFVYVDSPTDEVHVVYKRKDGNYGLIAPKI